MSELDVVTNEEKHRKMLANQAKKMIAECLYAVPMDENSLITSYQGFFVQLNFSEVHPLIVIGLVKSLPQIPGDIFESTNEFNLSSVLGSHAINKDVNCYSYRATLWLDSELSKDRFLEILDRCVEEAARGYSFLQ